MKKFIVLLLMLCPFVLFAQEHLKVKGIPIDGKAKDFIAKMKATGLVHRSGSGDDEILEGTFAGLSNCYFLFASSGKTQTVFRALIMTEEYSSWSSLKSSYEAIKESYVAKYPDNESFEYFSSPYYEGDGFEIQALRNDKCRYISFFNAPGGGIIIEMKAFSSGGGYILITYEDKQNTQLAQEERSEIINDDI